MAFNWNWVNSSIDTLKASSSIDKGSISLTSLKTPDKGILKASEIKNSIDSANSSITQVWRTWTSTIKPILDSLPAGQRDNRWRDGRGLPSKIDALVYGIQGTTLFAFNDATGAVADGRYWHSVDSRPKTISEVLEDLWDAISDLEGTSTTPGESTDLDPVWAAIGNHYKDPLLTSASSSLDYRTGVLETIAAMSYTALFDGFSGSPLAHSIAKNIDRILKIHGISGGWQNNPDSVNHNSVVPGAHDHAYTDIKPAPLSTLEANRAATVSSLYVDVQRLRYEITRTKGSLSWNQDVASPWQTLPTYTTLSDHINFVGSGTASSTNPHGVDYTDVGADTVFSNIANYIGMPDYTSSAAPIYSSTYYITQGNPIIDALNELDTAFHTYLGGGTVVRATYEYDRSAMTEEERLTTPIVVSHNTGKKPILSVLDASPEEYVSGMYSSPLDLNIIHVSNNEFQVWTGAAVVEIIALY
jgi:hypothetical protein